MTSISFTASLRDAIARYRRAYRATTKLLYGSLWDSPLQAMVHPDLKALKLQLARLTAVTEFDCIGLARIMESHRTFEWGRLQMGKHAPHKDTDPKVIGAARASRFEGLRLALCRLALNLERAAEEAKAQESPKRESAQHEKTEHEML